MGPLFGEKGFKMGPIFGEKGFKMGPIFGEKGFKMGPIFAYFAQIPLKVAPALLIKGSVVLSWSA